TGNLDTRTSVEVLALLQGLNRAGLTIVLVTHEPDIATYASRHLIFRDGRLRTDERVAAPVDAAAALTSLPRDEDEDAAGTSGRAAASRGGPSGSTSSGAH